MRLEPRRLHARVYPTAIYILMDVTPGIHDALAQPRNSRKRRPPKTRQL